MPNYQQTLDEVMRRSGGADPWGTAYGMRFRPETQGFRGRDEDQLRDVEHYLWARDRASLGPFGAMQMLAGIPGHAGLKMLGIKQGDTSLSDLLRSYQGVLHGVGDWGAGLPQRLYGGMK